MLLKLGTRRSALALTQSNWVKSRLEALHPGLEIELVGMDTQGDEVHQNRFSTEPLQTLDGKNFFVKELDDALLAGKTDFSVHSYKDLSLERPQELIVAAVPARENPRDIVLFHPSIHEKLKDRQEIVIGSASPRRAQNTPAFLRSVLPGQSENNAGAWRIMMKPLRGNVTTRLKKLEEGRYDGIILAMAGLNRLGIDTAQFPRMILPLDACPTAPAQGALAIECRRNDKSTKEILAALHDSETAFHIAREREVLRRYGGGCHQAFGATSFALGTDFPVTFIKGKSDAGMLLDQCEWNAPCYDGPLISWDGLAHRKASHTAYLLDTLPAEADMFFIAHHRAVSPSMVSQLQGKQLWVSGIASWRRLAQLGLWVEGCAENLGFSHIQPMLGPMEKWAILTHEAAVAEWRPARAIATYHIDASMEETSGLAEATHVYWSSGSQFTRLRHIARAVKYHACGGGKTATVLRAGGIEPDIFPSIKEWRKSVNI